MSDIRRTEIGRLENRAGYSPHRDWRSLRLLIVPDISTTLLVSLVLVPKTGHPHLHHQVRQLPAPWDPDTSHGDDSLYALSQALAAVDQTRR